MNIKPIEITATYLGMFFALGGSVAGALGNMEGAVWIIISATFLMSMSNHLKLSMMEGEE